MTFVDTSTGEVVHGEVVPFDASLVEQAADPGRFVELACARAKEWLAQALEQGDIEGIVELRSQAEAIRTYTAQKQLGKDAELSAQEIVRRAERGIGLAIRKGQEQGEIRRNGERSDSPSGRDKKVPTDFAKEHELADGSYPLAEASDDEFEQAMDEARDEENLSRTNLVRKVKERTVRKRKWNDEALTETFTDMSEKGHTSAQIASHLGMSEDYVRRHASRLGVTITADKVTGRVRRLDSDRIVENVASTLAGLAMSVDLASIDDLDPAQIEGWATSISDSLRTLNKFQKQLKEMAQ